MALPLSKVTDLDELERQVLFELDNDSRMPVSVLADRCGVSRDRAAYCLDSLQASGIVRGFSVGANPYRIGKTLYKTYFLLEKNEENLVQRMISFLKKQPGVFWIAEAEGRWDLVYAAFARTPYEFSGLQDIVLDKFGHCISSFELYTVIEANFFPRKYLRPGTRSPGEIGLGGEPADIELDEIDLRIIRALSDNARIPMTSLAAKVGLSPTASKYRIERLENEKIICGYHLNIALERIGFQSFKAQFYPKSHQIEHELLRFCRAHPHITCMIHQLGECKFEFEADVRDFNHYNEVLSDLRSNFSGTVRTINYRQVYSAGFPAE